MHCSLHRRGPTNCEDKESCLGGGRCRWSSRRGGQPPSVRAHRLGGRRDLPLGGRPQARPRRWCYALAPSGGLAPSRPRRLGWSDPRNQPSPSAPHIDVDPSQGTATQLANVMENDTKGFNLPDISQPADTWEDYPKSPAASPRGAGGPHESRLAALMADTALKEAKHCRGKAVPVFLDNERLWSWGAACVRWAQRPSPSPATSPLRVTDSPPSWRSMPRGHASCFSSLTSIGGSPFSPSPMGREMRSRPVTYGGSGSRFTT